MEWLVYPTSLEGMVCTASTRKDAPTAQHSIYLAMTSRLHCDNTETLELSVMLLAQTACLHTDSQEPRLCHCPQLQGRFVARPRFQRLVSSVLENSSTPTAEVPPGTVSVAVSYALDGTDA